MGTSQNHGGSIAVAQLPETVSASTCQWLHGEPTDRNFCGELVKRGSSYCPGHHDRCYRDWDIRPVRRAVA